MSLQDLCESLAYPPTHTYFIPTLTPTGVLKDRLDVISRVAPELFRGDSFLDIGSNKGFFSFLAARTCRSVVGIEPEKEYVELCRDVASTHRLKNVRFINATFNGSMISGQFDRVFIGNGPHYLYRDSGGFGYVGALASLSTDLLVTEGPVDMHCSDLHAFFQDGIGVHYNREELYAAMYPHWDFIAFASSPAYTPDRYVMVWKRVDDLLRCDMKRYAEYLRAVYGRMAEWITPEDHVAEICVRHDRGVISYKTIKCASLTGIDLNPSRCPLGGVEANAITDALPESDVFISTAILHHTPKELIGPLLANIRNYTRRYAIFSGPNAAVMKSLIGDHKWHINEADLGEMANESGFKIVHTEMIGLNEPYCEVLVVMETV